MGAFKRALTAWIEVSVSDPDQFWSLPYWYRDIFFEVKRDEADQMMKEMMETAAQCTTCPHCGYPLNSEDTND